MYLLAIKTFLLKDFLNLSRIRLFLRIPIQIRINGTINNEILSNLTCDIKISLMYH